MDAEQILEAATERLHALDIYAVLTVADAVIDQDEDSHDWQGNLTVKGQPDGRWDPNPDMYAGDEPGRHYLRVYAVDDDGELARTDGEIDPPIWSIDEIEVAEDNWTVEEILEDATKAAGVDYTPGD